MGESIAAKINTAAKRMMREVYSLKSGLSCLDIGNKNHINMEKLMGKMIVLLGRIKADSVIIAWEEFSEELDVNGYPKDGFTYSDECIEALYLGLYNADIDLTKNLLEEFYYLVGAIINHKAGPGTLKLTNSDLLAVISMLDDPYKTQIKRYILKY